MENGAVIWQVSGELFVGLAIPLATAILYLTDRIQRKHVWMMVWGFAFYFLGDSITVLPQTIWIVAPIVYDPGFIRINRTVTVLG